MDPFFSISNPIANKKILSYHSHLTIKKLIKLQSIRIFNIFEFLFYFFGKGEAKKGMELEILTERKIQSNSNETLLLFFFKKLL